MTEQGPKGRKDPMLLVENEFLSATLLDAINPNPDAILVSVSLRFPVGWEADDGAGRRLFDRFQFGLKVPVSAAYDAVIPCTLGRVLSRFEPEGGHAHYVLELVPAADPEGAHRTALELLMQESVRLRGRSWCTEVQSLLGWWAETGLSRLEIRNSAFVPESACEPIAGTTEETGALVDAFDAFCDEADLPEIDPDDILAVWNLGEPDPDPDNRRIAEDDAFMIERLNARSGNVEIPKRLSASRLAVGAPTLVN